jgi:hypothetical protein
VAIKIKLKHSATANKAPLPSDLDAGELALNTNAASPAAYLKDSAGNIVKLAGAGAVGATDATTTAKGVVQLADATAVTAGTAGRVVDAAQLKAATDADDWTRTGTTLSPKTAGDVVEVSAGTEALPGLTPVGDPDTGLWAPAADTLALSVKGGEALRIDDQKRVGIGTSSPNYELHINASDSTNFIQLTNSGTGTGASDGFLIYNNGVNATVSNQEAGYLSLETSGQARLHILSDGKVGIGTSTPGDYTSGADFVVASSAGNGAMTLAGANAGSPTIMFKRVSSPGTTRGYIQYDNTSEWMRFATNGSEALRIDSSQRVGIGTANPQALLDVAGVAAIKELRLQSGNGAYWKISVDNNGNLSVVAS